MAQPDPSTLTRAPDRPGSPLARFLRGWRKRGALGTARVLFVLAVVAALLAFSRPTLGWVLVGAPLVALGEAWRAWAAGHLVKSRELAVAGPYRHVQNPLYFGRLCILTGFALMAWMPATWGGRVVPLNVLALAVLLLLFFGYYLPRKRRVEGERLQRLHGAAYAGWARSVPLIFPALRPHGPPGRAWSVERFHENGEGWMVLLVAAVTAAFALRAVGAFG